MASLRIRSVLRATPEALRGLLRELPDDLACADYGEGTFSPFDVLGHLIVGEREDWIPRSRIILEHGASRPFEPFDHRATLPADDGWTTPSLLNEFARLRAANLEALDAMALAPADLEKTGMHPALGRVTLGELLHAWCAHDLHHIAQVCKGLAHQARDGVGPWRGYIGILNR